MYRKAHIMKKLFFLFSVQLYAQTALDITPKSLYVNTFIYLGD
jgi:hypothetical protein